MQADPNVNRYTRSIYLLRVPVSQLDTKSRQQGEEK